MSVSLTQSINVKGLSMDFGSVQIAEMGALSVMINLFIFFIDVWAVEGVLPEGGMPI